MAVTPSTMSPLGSAAPDFTLPDTISGRDVSLSDYAGEPLLVMFICNHCPYVVHVMDELARLGREYVEKGVGVMAICSNDATTHPADSFEKMGELAQKAGFRFPYLHDESQDVARAYDAVCTPDFFGFDAGLGLQYRGRLDESRNRPAAPDARRELHEAMMRVAETGQGPQAQTPSMGCSIKWKAA